jgi:hypothetical protein
MRMRSRWTVLGGVVLAVAIRPYAVATTDTGSCGNGWARDSLQRTYRVQKQKDGWRVERRDRGTFVTVGSRSPGACQAGRHGSSVPAGVRGTVQGKHVGYVTGGGSEFDPQAFCSGGDCGSTDVWVRMHFGPRARFSCLGNSARCRFSFEYRASGKGLRFKRWSVRGTGSGSQLRQRRSGDVSE